MKNIHTLCLLGFAVFFVCACQTNDNPETGENIQQYIDQLPPASERNDREDITCELIELAIEDGEVVRYVWNDGGYHDCPQAWLDSIDRARYYVGGPRWRTLDLIVEIDENDQLILDSQDDSDFETTLIPEGTGLKMFLAAKVGLVQVTQLEQQLGIDIETLDDIPANVQANLRGEGESEFSLNEVRRERKTMMVFSAGEKVYIINDGEHDYAMKFFSAERDSTLNDIALLDNLDQRFTKLPEGYTYRVEVLEEDLYIVDVDRIAYVLGDEFSDSYDRIVKEE